MALSIPINIVSHFFLAIVYAATLIMLTVGLNMVYSVLKFSNFAHAEFITFGMFTSWWLLQILTFAIPWDSAIWEIFGIPLRFTLATNDIPIINFIPIIGDIYVDISIQYLINNLLVQALFAFVMVGLLGIASEVLIFSRLRKLVASPRSFTVASIGIGLIVRNFLAMIFGNFPKPKIGSTSDASLPLDLNFSIKQDIISIPLFGSQGIFITTNEFLIIAMSIITVLGIDYLFRNTKFGIAMRATSDSFELAQVSGINTKKIVFYTWFLAAGLTGFGAALLRANQPRFSIIDGFMMLLPIFAVVILGGVGSFRGGIIAALIISFARQSTVILFTIFQKPGGLEDFIEWIFYNFFKLFGLELPGVSISFAPGYADGVGFVVLIIVLLFRPQGISGSVEATRARV